MPNLERAKRIIMHFHERGDVQHYNVFDCYTINGVTFDVDKVDRGVDGFSVELSPRFIPRIVKDTPDA